MFFATDIANFLACQHIATLNRAEAAGEISKKFYADPGADLLRRLGLEHEQKYLRELIDVQALKVVAIPANVPWRAAAALTQEAMAAGADSIYQATFLQTTPLQERSQKPTFLDETWGGRADFLLRVETPSKLGPWSYEVVETKLARSTKARAIIQLCFYSDLVARIQGLEPKRMHVVLGGGAKAEEFQVQRYVAYFRKVRREFQAALAAKPITYPEPVEHCAVCSWFTNCDDRRHTDDHLSLVAGITSKQRKALVERDVSTVVLLGALPLPVNREAGNQRSEIRDQRSENVNQRAVRRIAEAPLMRIREQARVQVQGREEGRLVYELLESVEAARGLGALPLPSPGDIFLDFEGDPYALDEGLEYLIGTVTESPAADPVYESLWAFNRVSEKQAFEKFIDSVMERRRQYPDMHIYHYAAYEQTAIKHLTGRHGVRTDAVDQLLRAEVFVDLFRVVRQGLRASVESYSIKKMEPFYGFVRAVPLRDATSALQAFEAVLALGDDQSAVAETLKTIEDYNRDDCVSTWRLRSWLETLRSELEGKIGQLLPRPEAKSGEAGEALAEQLGQVDAVMGSLTDGLPTEEADWTEEQRARWLLAQMLEWHRREDKSKWWEYYRLCELTDDELQEDKNALAGLIYLGEVGQVKKSIIHRYQFPPQDHSIDRARAVHDPRTQKGVGEIVAIDERNRTIDVKRITSSKAPHPTALIANDIVGSTVQRDSLLRLGSWVADNSIDALGPFRAARDLLLRKQPRVGGGSFGAVIDEHQPTESAKRVALSLESSVFPIQGPPGSGKTYTGARMILELTKQGKRVGVTAVSHKVISNLLRELCKAAHDEGVSVQAVQKANEFDGCEEAQIVQVETNEEIFEALSSGEAQVAAGTAWLWGREEMASSLDVLFVDEAGQMSLANVLAISQAAKSIVLLGDPQQLDQPQQGVHPPGAEVSALAHLLNGRATIGPDEGLFLVESWRLHPDVCAFTSEVFYDGRLASRAENQIQRLNVAGPLDGTGLRFAPVTHVGNQNESREEVESIAGMIEQLMGNSATWTNKKGDELPLRLKDILIVAPYNAQVSALARRLPAGARVGTVDKFQGQEAPIVFYSMTTSTPEDAPRGMAFLFSSNRLNVATSRAQCVTVLVASPALFQVQCKTPRQIELANAFCRYLEMAQPI